MEITKDNSFLITVLVIILLIIITVFILNAFYSVA